MEPAMPHVFISYSRKDVDFAAHLHEALAQRQKDVWRDKEDIPLTADWWQEICAGIEAADNFLFIISPDSVRSDVCRREIEHAVSNNKRLVPVNYREVTDPADKPLMHPALNSHNWVPFAADEDFDTFCQTLIAALDTDLEYVRGHTHFLVRAKEWQRRKRLPGFLLTRSEMREARRWLKNGANKQPPPTHEHREFIRASQRELNRQRAFRILLLALMMISGALAFVAAGLWITAEDNAAVARRNAAAAQAAEATAVLLGERSLSLSLAAQSQLELSGSQQELPAILGLEALANYPPTWQAERALGLAVLNSRLQHLFVGHTDMVFNATFSPDGARALTASADFTARLLDTRTGAELARYESPDSPIFNARYSPDGRRIALGLSSEIVILDADLGETLLVIPDDTLIGLALAWSPDGSKIAASVTSEEIGDRAAVWDAETGELLAVTDALDDLVLNLDWSPDGTRLVTAGGADTLAIIWDAETGEHVKTLDGHTDIVNAAAWHPDGSLIVTAGDDQQALLWDAQTGDLLALLPHSSPVVGAAWSPDGSLLATISGEGRVLIWVTEYRKMVLQFTTGTSFRVNWSPDARRIITAGEDGTTRIWSLIPAGVIGFNTTLGYKEAAWSPDGTRWLTASSSPNSAVIFGPHAESALLEIPSEGGTLGHGAAWSPDGRLVALASDGSITRLYDAATGQSMSPELEGTLPAWSPDGARLVTASKAELLIWDTAAWGEPVRLTGHQDAITDTAWSPDGARLLSTSQDGTARVWDAAAGQEIGAYISQASDMTAAAFSPDGTLVAAGSKDGTAYIWDAASRDRVQMLTGHIGSITALDWSPDGQRLVTASADSTARIWDVRTGNELVSITSPDIGFLSVDWSPGGDALLLVSGGGIVQEWFAWQQPDALVAFARDCCLIRALTPEERLRFGLAAQ
ncbi:MAG: TIR domain-containing protein [Chloroflexi bacterium]|nr:TIR domain-containing protein [Chloroflexota bacterium]MDL1884040.1 TIR domain-containing protein [Anaerolineae bacterium CFX8]